MSKDLKRILLCVDGSEQSFEGLRYVGRLLPRERVKKMTLFNVMDTFPEMFWGVDIELDVPSHRLDITTWEIQERDRIEDFAERVRRLLLSQGFREEAIEFVVKKREAGVARDIAMEAQKGYDALILGRRGVSEVKDFIFGSTAEKLVGHLQSVPVWVVGGSPDPGKILVAIDRSDGAMRALDYVGDLFGGMHPELLLLHIRRIWNVLSPSRWDLTQEHTSWPEESKGELERIEKEVASLFRECIKRLEQKGADINRIKTKLVPVPYNPALAIYRQARSGGYGTIVVGRRGISRTEEFIMGSVSSQILQLANDMAVWVVH